MDIPAYVPSRAIIAGRLSAGDGPSLATQLDDGTALAARMGWGILRTAEEPDTTAFRRRKILLPDGRHELRVVRPVFRQILDDLASGAADGLIALDLDRALRDPRDLEDLIDVIESKRPRIPVTSVTGSLRLDNDADITMARVMTAINNKSSRDTARRVARAKLRRAMEGQFNGPTRPYGFEPGGIVHVPAECAVINEVADMILGGVSVRNIVRYLNECGVVTAEGSRWTPTGLREMMRRARNAGIAVYRDSECGPAVWAAVLPEEKWRAVVARIDDRSRTTGVKGGPAPRWLGSGIYLCHCGDVLNTNKRPGNRQVYRCRSIGQAQNTAGGHGSRDVRLLDEYVVSVIVRMLSTADAADIYAPPVATGPDTADVRAELALNRQRESDLVAAFTDGAITLSAMKDGVRRIKDRVDAAVALLASRSAISPVADLAATPDVRAGWDVLSLGTRRVIVDRLITVRVSPSSVRGRGRFDLDTIEITPKATTNG